MPETILLVDMDGTLARFHDEADYLERMFEEGFFESLQPFSNVVDGIRLFIHTHPEVKVYTCSAEVDSPFCIQEKNRWLDKYLPEIRSENRLYTAIGRSKATYLEGGANSSVFLLDDYNKGLHMFQYDGGRAIKCHNNINQKGLGAHGGERGYMWTGPMIHTDDPPALIAEELAQLMGLEHHIEAVTTRCGIQLIPEIKKTDAPSKYYDKGFRKHLTVIHGGEEDISYLATSHDKYGRDTVIFRNPFNAVRYLNGDQLAYEYSMRLYDGVKMSASGYQMQAICQNSYGTLNFHRYLYADSAQMAEEVKKALQHRNDAIVGFVREITPGGEEVDYMTYYRHEDMLRHIRRCEERNQPHRAEWFINPPARDVDISHQDSLSERIRNAQGRVKDAAAGASEVKSPDML